MRIQILPLPTVVKGDDVTEPFALIVDRHEGTHERIAEDASVLARFMYDCGALALLVTKETVEVVDRYAQPPVTVTMTDTVIKDAKPFRACTECSFVYETQEDWKREYNRVAPIMMMPWPLRKVQAADTCPRCLHTF
jgi:hypothetical protein